MDRSAKYREIARKPPTEFSISYRWLDRVQYCIQEDQGFVAGKLIVPHSRNIWAQNHSVCRRSPSNSSDWLLPTNVTQKTYIPFHLQCAYTAVIRVLYDTSE